VFEEELQTVENCQHKGIPNLEDRQDFEMKLLKKQNRYVKRLTSFLSGIAGMKSLVALSKGRILLSTTWTKFGIKHRLGNASKNSQSLLNSS
jgi:transposase-like protein